MVIKLMLLTVDVDLRIGRQVKDAIFMHLYVWIHAQLDPICHRPTNQKSTNILTNDSGHI